MKILLTLFLSISITFTSATLYLGFDTSSNALSQSFFDCAAGRINYNQNGFAIIPYIPTADIAGQVIQAKVAGFLEVHMLIDPDQISTQDPSSLASAAFSALRYRGTGVSGIWLKVNGYGVVWTSSASKNIALIKSILNPFKQIMTQNFGDVVLGVYTTSSDWQQITGGDKTIGAGGYLYWSGYFDSMNCESPSFAFKGCYIQQIQMNNMGCGNAMNVDVKNIEN
jgi:hypothetical protein